MKRSAIIGTAIFALAVAGQALAQQDIPSELSGEIDSYFVVPSSADSDGHLIVRVIPDDARDASENILVDLGPPRDTRQQDVRPGTRISASGYADKAAGFDVLVAEETNFGAKRSQDRQARAQDFELSEREDQPRERTPRMSTPQQQIQRQIQSQMSQHRTTDDESTDAEEPSRTAQERQAQQKDRQAQAADERQEQLQDWPTDERQEQQARAQDFELSEQEDQPRERGPRMLTPQQQIHRQIQSQMSQQRTTDDEFTDAEEPSRTAQERQAQQKDRQAQRQQRQAQPQDWLAEDQEDPRQARAQQERQSQQDIEPQSAETQAPRSGMQKTEEEVAIRRSLDPFARTSRQIQQRMQSSEVDSSRDPRAQERQITQDRGARDLDQRDRQRFDRSTLEGRRELMKEDTEFKKVARGDYERRGPQAEQRDRQFAKAFSEFWGYGQSQDTNTIHGTVDSTKDISIKGVDDDHRFVKVRSEQTEDTWIVDLGAIGNLKQIDLQAGDRVMIQGQPAKLDDRPVLRATQVAELVPLNENRQSRSAARGYERDEQRR